MSSYTYVQRARILAVYRSADNVWSEQPFNSNGSPPLLRSSSPLKNKLAALSQRFSNGAGHDGASGKPTPHVTLSPQHPQQARDTPHNGDLLLSSAGKAYQATRRRHTNSFMDKPSGAIDFSLSMRRDLDRAQFMSNGLRARQASSKQRNYVNSKTSFYEVNEHDIYPSVVSGDASPPINSLASTQRLYESTFDLTAHRKSIAPGKSRSFHVPMSGTGAPVHYSSTHEVTHDRAEHDPRRTTSKEQITSATRPRQTPGAQSVASTTVVAYTPGQRHPSAQSYASRDANISYAYTNVKKYIEENALMSPEKEESIRHWVRDVDKHRQEFQHVESFV